MTSIGALLSVFVFVCCVYIRSCTLCLYLYLKIPFLCIYCVFWCSVDYEAGLTRLKQAVISWDITCVINQPLSQLSRQCHC